MKKTYAIEVDCANCANLMEEAAGKTEGVASAVVNFMTQKMIVEFAEGADPKKVMKDVLKACKKVEPDCENRALIHPETGVPSARQAGRLPYAVSFPQFRERSPDP